MRILKSLDTLEFTHVASIYPNILFYVTITDSYEHYTSRGLVCLIIIVV